nr:hypothetical protein CFP56_27901 [Quercus suber]
MKVIETVNVVIDKSSNSSSEKGIEELPKEILPPEPKEVQDIVEQEPASPSTPGTLSVVKTLQTYLLHQILNLTRRKDLPPGLD